MYDLYFYDGGHTLISKHVTAEKAMAASLDLSPGRYEVWDSNGKRIARIKITRAAAKRATPRSRLSIFSNN